MGDSADIPFLRAPKLERTEMLKISILYESGITVMIVMLMLMLMVPHMSVSVLKHV